MTRDGKLLCAGTCGTVVAALCCFTPLLAILLGAIGLGAWLGGADAVVIPALVGFLLLTGYALYRLRRTDSSAGRP